MPTFPAHAFREYDIRGIAGDDITRALAHSLGMAYATMLPENEGRPVVVGRDVRLTGPELQHALIAGLNAAGIDVIDIGMVPTPLAYFGVFHLDAAGCIMVTASHNPGEYNGFKMMLGRESMHGEQIRTLYARMHTHIEAAITAGTHVEMNLLPAYHERLVHDIRLARPLKVVIDAGNGPSGIVAAPLFRDLGCEVIELYCEPDGNFPNHHPDPTVEANMRELSEAVIEHGADLGMGFDGDGDRLGIVDEHGRIIWGDMLLLLLSRHLLRTHPGATIISEVKCSQHMYDDIAAHGGQAIMWRTGHSPIKAKMKQTGALLAGEMSGHIFFADRYFGFDDAVYAGGRIMEMLAAQDAPMSALLDDVPAAVTTPEIRVDCADSRKFALVEEAKTHFGRQGYDIIDVDGMRLKFADGWGLLRASNTQPSLVLRFEAPNAARLAEMRELVEGWLRDNA
jgi:phosphomannomutase/phosphoglucomutase